MTRIGKMFEEEKERAMDQLGDAIERLTAGESLEELITSGVDAGIATRADKVVKNQIKIEKHMGIMIKNNKKYDKTGFSHISCGMIKELFDVQKHPDRFKYLMELVTEQNMDEQPNDWSADIKICTKFGSECLMFIYGEDAEKIEPGIVDFFSKRALILFLITETNNQEQFSETGNQYIHKFESMEADSGLILSPPIQMYVVQADKCYKQYLAGFDEENNRKLQLLLSLLIEPGNPRICEDITDDHMFTDIYNEIMNT